MQKAKALRGNNASWHTCKTIIVTSTDNDSTPFPPLLDPWQAAGRLAVYSGRIALSQLSRLHDKIVGAGAAETATAADGGASPYLVPLALESIKTALAGVPAAELAGTTTPWFTAAFMFDDQRRPCVQLQVAAVLPLLCQRSLQVYWQAVAAASQIVVVTDETEAEALPDELEPVLLTHKQLALRDLVEEELLLALPLVPIAPQVGEAETITTGAEVPSTKQRKPFADLAQLLARGDQHAED